MSKGAQQADGLSQAEPEVSALRASIPSAGEVFIVIYPFVRDTYTAFDEDGQSERETWRPGVNYVEVSEDHAAPVADDVGQALFTVVDVFKPGRFPTRVFYTRQFVTPEGRRFGKTRLHIATLEKFRRLVRRYQYPFGIGKPLPSDRQWWKPSQAEAEFRELLRTHAAQANEAGAAETQSGSVHESAVGTADVPKPDNPLTRQWIPPIPQEPTK